MIKINKHKMIALIISAIMLFSYIRISANDISVTMINYEDNFDQYSSYVAVSPANIINGWSQSWGVKENNPFVFKKEGSNTYLYADMWKDRPVYTFEQNKPNGKITVQVSVEMVIANNSAGIYDYDFIFGDSVMRTRFYFTAENTISGIDTFNQKGGVYTSLGNLDMVNQEVKRNTWVNLRWEIDTDENTLQLYINNNLVNTKPADITYAVGPLEEIRFNIGTNVVGMSLGIDNVKISSEYKNSDDLEVRQKAFALTDDMFTTEAPYAVTKDLTLPQIDGCNVSYTSSSNSVIVNSDRASVVRTEEDTPVTITATVSKGSSVYERQFDFTVKGTEWNVHTSEGFVYSSKAGERIDKAYGGWYLDKESQTEGYLDAVYETNSGKSEIKIFRDIADSKENIDHGEVYYDYSGAESGTVTTSMRIRLAPTLEDKSKQIYVLRLYAVPTGTNYSEKVCEIQFQTAATGSTMNLTGQLSDTVPTNGKYMDISVKADVLNKKIHVYKDGKLLTGEGVDFSGKNASYSRLACFAMQPFRSYKNASITMDSFAVFSQSGIEANVAAYKNGEKISDLGYLENEDILSADAVIYNADTEESIHAIAAVYDDGELYKMYVMEMKNDSGHLLAHFPHLNIPENLKKMSVKFYFFGGKTSLTPVCDVFTYPHKMNSAAMPEKITDTATGREYYAMDMNGTDVLRSYYTQPMWKNDNSGFYFYDRQLRLYDYDITSGEYYYIDTLFGEQLAMVSAKGNLFYVADDKTIKRRIPDGTTTYIGELYNGVKSALLLQVNDDESYLSIETFEKDTELVINEKRIPVMNIATGVWNTENKHKFDTVYYEPNHMNINPNPKYSNIVIFSHEGNGANGEGCADRMWALDINTGEKQNIFKQKMYTSTMPAEIVSHEGWMANGEEIMFAANKKRHPQTGEYTTPAGICIVNKDGTNRRYIYNTDENGAEYNYLHPSGSLADNRFVVSDTSYNGETTDLVLVDCFTGQTHHLATLPQNGQNPGHTHPNFSRDGKTVIFGLYSEDFSTIRIGWMDISDIVDNAPNGESIDLSSSCSTTSYVGTDFYISSENNLYRIQEGNHLNVNINTFEKETANVKITVEYLDEGTGNVIIDYLKWETENGVNTSNTYSERIALTGSGKIKTAVIELIGINAENLKPMGADFTLRGDEGDIKIQSVSVQEV